MTSTNSSSPDGHSEFNSCLELTAKSPFSRDADLVERTKRIAKTDEMRILAS